MTRARSYSFVDHIGAFCLALAICFGVILIGHKVLTMQEEYAKTHLNLNTDGVYKADSDYTILAHTSRNYYLITTDNRVLAGEFLEKKKSSAWNFTFDLESEQDAIEGSVQKYKNSEFTIKLADDDDIVGFYEGLEFYGSVTKET